MGLDRVCGVGAGAEVRGPRDPCEVGVVGRRGGGGCDVILHFSAGHAGHCVGRRQAARGGACGTEIRVRAGLGPRVGATGGRTAFQVHLQAESQTALWLGCGRS